MTDQEKIDYIKSYNIPYVKTSLYPLNLIYKFAQISELIKDRTDGITECFGTHDPNDSSCKECFLHENGTCKMLKEYTHLLNNKDDLIAIANRVGEIQKMTEESIDDILSKIKFREDTVSYKIARMILSSNDKSFGELINNIQSLCPERDIIYARTRYYQIKRKIQESTDLEIKTVTQKFIHITKRIHG